MRHRSICSLALVLALGISATTPTEAQDGRTKAMTCAACHGAEGNSVNPDWPNLAGQHADYIVSQLAAYKAGERSDPNMNAMAAPLSEQDMADIAAYFAAQALSIPSVENDDTLAAGAALYRGGDAETGVPACMACHGPDGSGNAAADYPALRGQHAKYTAKQLEAYKAGARTTDPQSIMRSIAARMSSEDIESVSRFIQGLH